MGIVDREERRQQKVRRRIHEVCNIREFRFSSSCIRFVKARKALMKIFVIYYLQRTLLVCLFLNINQLDALNSIISLFQASTCFEHMCSSSGGQKLCYIVSGIITLIGVMIPETV